ncbi:unnamed protein product, partial [Ectocarpus fasciculatus]
RGPGVRVVTLSPRRGFLLRSGSGKPQHPPGPPAELCGFVRPQRDVRSHPGSLPGRKAARPSPPRGVLHAVRAERGGAE